MQKRKYRVRNWRDYNESLIRRGNLYFWLDEATLKEWKAKPKQGKRGRPKQYSDLAITCGLTLKALFHLTFRMVEGFIHSLLELQGLDYEVFDYSLLCKRQKDLKVTLPVVRAKPGEAIHLVVDTTGLKVYGEGEWKVRQHGWMKHRLWRKLHLGVNEKTQMIEAMVLTELGVQDCEGLPPLVEQIEVPIETGKGDGSYDRFRCYEAAVQGGFDWIAPPQHNAKTSAERRRNRHKASAAAVKQRDATIEQVRQQGRQAWKVAVGYHQRSLAETAIFRLKTFFGPRLSTRKLAHQQTEAAIWCRALNQITSLGMPQSVAI